MMNTSRAADVLLDFDEDFHVGETADDGLGERQMSQLAISCARAGLAFAGDELDGAVLGRHRPFSRALLDTMFSISGYPQKDAFQRAR